MEEQGREGGERQCRSGGREVTWFLILGLARCRPQTCHRPIPRICVYVQTLPGQGVFADVFKLKTLRWEMNLGHPSDLMSSQVSYKREEGGS